MLTRNPLDVDSTAVEACTGLFISVLSFWCWVSDWFGGWLDNMRAYAGYEIYVLLMGVPYGIYHFHYSRVGTRFGRSMRCIFAAWVLVTMAASIWLSKGYSPPGVPALVLAAIIQAWCFLKIKWNHGH